MNTAFTGMDQPCLKFLGDKWFSRADYEQFNDVTNYTCLVTRHYSCNAHP